MVLYLSSNHNLSIRKACSLLEISRRTYYYVSSKLMLDDIDVIYALILVLEEVIEREEERSIHNLYNKLLENGHVWPFKMVKRIYQEYKLDKY